MTDPPGKFLKKEREMRNISLEEISKVTKIREHHLKAIEEDRYELLPHTLYVKGYLNVYARYLALDPKDIVLHYQNYLASLAPPEPILLQQQVAAPKKRVRSWFFFSLIFTSLLFMTIFIFYPAQQLTEKKPKPILPSSALPSPAIQQEVRVQTINTVQQKESSELEKLEVNPSTHRPEAQGLLRVDPGPPLLTPSLKTGIATAEWNKDVTTQQTPDFKVLEASIGKGVERDGVQQFLTGKCLEFKSNYQRGYFFTRIKTLRVGKIAHIWLWEGKEHYRMEIDIKPPAWSVYSYFTFRPQHAGNWKVEARNGDHVLTSLDFKVVQPTADGSL